MRQNTSEFILGADDEIYIHVISIIPADRSGTR